MIASKAIDEFASKFAEINAFNARALGLTNEVKARHRFKKKGLQFFEVDEKKFLNNIGFLKLLKEIMPFDCHLIETKRGYHFISFAIQKGLTVKKAIKKARDLSRAINGDYGIIKEGDLMPYALVLRVSAKRLDGKIVNPKPHYVGCLWNSHDFKYSLAHLRVYSRVIGIPALELLHYRSYCKAVKTTANLWYYQTIERFL